MKGSNKIFLTQAALIEAIEEYLNRRLVGTEQVTVGCVKEWKEQCGGSHTLHIVADIETRSETEKDR